MYINKMDYKIIICSYNRPNILLNYTLKLLKDNNIDIKKIYIFLHNEEQLKKYKEIIKEDYNFIIHNKNCLVEGLRFIFNYFNEGDKLYRLDDDILYFKKRKYLKKDFNKGLITRKQIGILENYSLEKFIIEGFKKLDELGFTIFSPNHQTNGFFMTDNYSIDLRLIFGSCCGYINKKNKKYDFKYCSLYGCGEDIEQTIIRYKNDGGVLRFGDFTFIPLPPNTKGGISDSIGGKGKVKDKYKEINKLFIKYYNDYGYIKKNKYYGEIFKLKRNPKIKKNK